MEVNLIIRHKGGIVLLKGKAGWALPGGHLEQGESLEQAAMRVAKDETCLTLNALRQFHTYSGERYPGCPIITSVFIAEGKGELKAEDNASVIAHIDKLPELAYDHKRILMDYQNGEFEGMD